MTVEVNGELLEFDPSATVAAIVARTGAGVASRGVAVAIDGEVVPRSEWGNTRLSDGQRIEVVGAMQGG